MCINCLVTFLPIGSHLFSSSLNKNLCVRGFSFTRSMVLEEKEKRICGASSMQSPSFIY